MGRKDNSTEDRYEVVIKKIGHNAPVETDILGDSETQEILTLIGRLNLRSMVVN